MEKTEIVIFEAFAGLLSARVMLPATVIEWKIPLPRPIGNSIYDVNNIEEYLNNTQYGVFKFNGKTNEEGLRIFELYEVKQT